MSGKYIVSESSSMMRALETNLKQSQRVIDSLKRGTSQLTSSLQEGNLKGKTYGAARDYVLNVLNPLISKASEGISDGVSDLATYKYEDSQIAHYGNIDVAKLKNEKKIKEASKRKVAGQRERLQHLPLSALAVASPMAYGAAVSGMFSFENSMNDSIKKIDEKLLAYETFNTNTNSLFSDTTAVFDALEAALNVLNKIKFNGEGSGLIITLPGNIDGLVGKVTGSNLTAGDSDSSYGSIQSLAEELEISPEEAERLCKKYKVQPTDNIAIVVVTQSYGGVQHGAKYVINKTTNQIVSQEGWGASGEVYKTLEGIGDQMGETVVGFSNNAGSDKNNMTYDGDLGLAGFVESILTYDELVRSNESQELEVKGSEYLKELFKQLKKEEFEKWKKKRENEILHQQRVSEGNPATLGD